MRVPPRSKPNPSAMASTTRPMIRPTGLLELELAPPPVVDGLACVCVWVGD
jgi:hypothetical protein